MMAACYRYIDMVLHPTALNYFNVLCCDAFSTNNIYIYLCFAHFAYLYYSQFTGRIGFMYSVIGYITLLCMASR